ncbi:hypothetical protein [Mesorhizobium wenxiniae]|uniref:Uncharacterized protein n=1 Tax=Mesorhizobium wenxiniae TaxID=2014805 RepID=A0A271KIH5_9HYPH|nr:hypothetical protein [Mesorhizobium wenxiniae]PAP95631.1 hypothetical protein CIT31_09795 [Mesorhizobium wenxiniae]
MNEALHANEALFENGPPVGLQRRLGFVRGSQLNVGRRAMIVGAVGWAPLLVLAGMQNVTMHTDAIAPLLWDAGAVPDRRTTTRLGRSAVRIKAQCHRTAFCRCRLVTEKDRGTYDAAVASTRALLNWSAAEIVVIGLAYLLMCAAVFSLPFDQVPVWHKTGGLAPAFSPAGWWHVLVSLPLLLTLLLGWGWRFALWAHLLWRIARIDLRLLASHPDGVAGLAVLGYSLRAFSLIAMALATIVAGRSAHIVLVDGALPREHTIFPSADSLV